MLELPASRSGQSFSETDGASYRVTVPVRPQVKLGDYANFPFTPADRRAGRRPGRPGRSSSCATSRRRSSRSRTAAREGRLRGHRVRGPPGRRAGRGCRVGAVAAGHRQRADDPGLRGRPHRHRARTRRRPSRSRFPEDYGEDGAGRQARRVHGRLCASCASAGCRRSTTPSPSRWAPSTTSPALRADILAPPARATRSTAPGTASPTGSSSTPSPMPPSSSPTSWSTARSTS